MESETKQQFVEPDALARKNVTQVEHSSGTWQPRTRSSLNQDINMIKTVSQSPFVIVETLACATLRLLLRELARVQGLKRVKDLRKAHRH